MDKPGTQLADGGVDDPLLRRDPVVAREDLPERESWREGHSMFLHRRENRLIPWPRAGSGVSDDIHSAANRGQQVGVAIWVNEDGLARSMRFAHSGLNRVLRKCAHRRR